MKTSLVAERLEVLHDFPHVFDRHDDEGGDAEHQEVAEGGQAARHGQAQELCPGAGKHITYLKQYIIRTQ